MHALRQIACHWPACLKCSRTFLSHCASAGFPAVREGSRSQHCNATPCIQRSWYSHTIFNINVMYTTCMYNTRVRGLYYGTNRAPRLVHYMIGVVLSCHHQINCSHKIDTRLPSCSFSAMIEDKFKLCQKNNHKYQH